MAQIDEMEKLLYVRKCKILLCSTMLKTEEIGVFFLFLGGYWWLLEVVGCRRFATAPNFCVSGANETGADYRWEIAYLLFGQHGDT